MAKILKQNMNDPTYQTQKAIGNLQRELENLHNFQRKINSNTNLVGVQREISHVLTNIENSIPKQSLEALQKIGSEVIGKHVQFLQEVKGEIEFNESTHWWRIDGVLDDLPVQEVKSAKDKEAEEKTFTELLKTEVRKNDFAKLKEVEGIWFSYEFLSENRKEILHDVIRAYMEAKHTLVVPSITPQLEYFSKKYAFKYNNRYFGSIRTDGNSSSTPLLDYIEWSPLYIFYNSFFPENGGDAENIHNRHLILHGVVDNYATEEISLRLILFLDKLLRLIDKDLDDDETVEIAEEL